MTPSEKYILELCDKTFMAFWSFPNPIGKKNKELCDVIVVFDPYVIIISVKDIAVSNHQDENIQYDRWVKKAILKSSDQIYGAERHLKAGKSVKEVGSQREVNIPPNDRIKIFRIAIAFGSDTKFPLKYGDFGNGFVHVLDEKSTHIIFNELDTIKDFILYLEAKERFILEGNRLFACYESDFLAIYLQTGMSSLNYDTLVLSEGIWDSYVRSKDYRKYVEKMEVSYIWDSIIGKFSDDLRSGRLASSMQVEQLTLALKFLNKEDREDRRRYSEHFADIIQKNLRSRCICPPNQKEYKYLLMPIKDKNIKFKEILLQTLCEVARCEGIETPIVIGISYRTIDGRFEFDLAYSEVDDIDDAYRLRVSNLKSKMGFFGKK